ncbi:Qat anti-phage system QueC-like protein QatC [Pandoraea anhela]|nr:Qat anti-phage system QueC-like protein QatC [Pandoraea anhela]
MNVGTIAPGWRHVLSRAGLTPSVQIWDFVSLGLAVAAADLTCLRAGSADGWTRVINLDVHLHDPAPWEVQREALQEMLRFLTGDFWTLNLLPGGEPPPQSTAPLSYDADCVSLLSGGMDSLVGAIDLTAAGRRPLFVSQVAKGDKHTQRAFARALGAADRHFQWNHRVRLTHASERSTRGRSIVFFAFAALASCAIDLPANGRAEVFVPENGFISLNVPLTPGRFGSFSTKTTHPVLLSRLQAIWDAVGIPAQLVSPYSFATKGEMLTNCANQALLQQLVGESTSCGRFGYYNYTHCGRCVPCMVRRGGFIRARMPDTTRTYRFHDLATTGRTTGANDIGAAALAYLRAQAVGASRLFGGALSFADGVNRPLYEGVVQRGLEELGVLLGQHGVV